MNTRTRWMFIVSLTLVITALIFIPMTEAKRDRKSSSVKKTALLGSKEAINLERDKGGLNSWKSKALPQQREAFRPIVSRAAVFAVSKPARELPSSGAGDVDVRNTPQLGREINKKNRDIQREPIPGANPIDAALHRPTSNGKRPSVSGPSAIAPPSLVFEGLADTDNGAALVNPPDTVGAVGPNHYVQAVNNRVRVFDKTGAPLTAPFTQSSLFSSLYPQVGGICATNDNGDPIVLYDRMADRFQISQFSFTGQTTPPYHQCIAVSQTNDPTGAWFVYDFVLPGNQFPDYPKLGTWPDAYYMSTRQFTNGGPFAGEGAFAFDRRAMLLGDPNAALIYFDLGSLSISSSGMLPSDFDGIIPPPAGAPNVFAIYTSSTFGDPQGNALRLFDFHADFVNPGNSTFTERPESPVAVAAFDPRNPNGRADIEQPAPALPADNLDVIGDRLMFRLVYRNRSGTESLVANHSVNVSGLNGATPATHQAGVRYYELRKTTPGGPYSIHDQATFAPDAGNPVTGINRWMASAAIDNSGNLAVGYSVSSTTAVPGIRYAGRSAAFTGGLDEGEATMFAGQGTQQASLNRWGDYSGLTVDPVDDCTFWYTNEYYPTGHTQFNWKTKVGAFTVASCTAPAQGTLTGTVTDCASGIPMSGVLVEVSGGPSAGFSASTLANGTYSMKLAPGSYTVTFSGRSCALAGPFNVTITDGGTTTVNTCVSGAPRIGFVNAVVSGGNGNGIIDANECNSMNITINNPGCGPLTGATAVLSSSTPGVFITQPNSPYPDIPINGMGTNTVPFQINTSTGLVCGTNIDFTLTVTSSQGTFTVSFQMPTCTLTGSGSITNSDPTQNGRMTRNGVVSTCAANKPFPGINDTALRHFDQYSFTNAGSATACATFTVSNACANNLYYATYLGSFNPANIAENFLGDPGSTATTQTWSVNVPAGQTVVLVVHEVTANAGCGSYNFTISGLPTDGGGACPVPIAVAAGSTIATESCPPSNNAVDPGERVTVNLKVMNIGGVPTTNLVGTLLPTGGVTAPSDPQSYGSIPAGGMAGRDFSFTAAGNCGDTITATLQLQDGSTNLGTVTYTFTLGSLTPPVTTNYSSGNIAVTVPDNTTVDVPITVADTGLLSDVNAKIRLNQTFDGDMIISLVHPDGTVVALSNGRGGSGDNFGTGNNDCSGTPTVFDDSASTAIGAGTPPFAGSFRPETPLSALNGKPANGIWKLRFTDVGAGDVAVVGCVQLELTTQQRVCTANCGTVRLVVTSTLTRVDATTVRANYTVQNIGTSTAANVMLTTGRLGSTNGTPLPQALGSIPPAGSASSQINFTNSTPGASSTLVLGGTFTGGTFSTTRRVTIP